jgi:hypothetical protein
MKHLDHVEEWTIMSGGIFRDFFVQYAPNFVKSLTLTCSPPQGVAPADQEEAKNYDHLWGQRAVNFC